jgi:two-component system, cell cycle response regulator DivK
MTDNVFDSSIPANTQDSLDLMVYLLKHFGHTPLSARDGLERIEAARREVADLILCDIQLPGADGLDVCRQLKKDPALRNIPMVAVTAYAMVGDREKLLGEGFNGYLSKPINPPTTGQAPVIATRRRVLVVDNALGAEAFFQEPVDNEEPMKVIQRALIK